MARGTLVFVIIIMITIMIIIIIIIISSSRRRTSSIIITVAIVIIIVIIIINMFIIVYQFVICVLFMCLIVWRVALWGDLMAGPATSYTISNACQTIFVTPHDCSNSSLFRKQQVANMCDHRRSRSRRPRQRRLDLALGHSPFRSVPPSRSRSRGARAARPR